jgi:hypothetical protein
MENRKMNPNSLANLRAPWRKGETPNPRGINRKRPITDEYFAQACELVPERLRQRFNRRAKMELLKPGMTWAQAIALRMCYEALMEGSTRAAREMREAIEGKAPQRLEITGPERKEVTIRVVYEKRGNRQPMDSFLQTPATDAETNQRPS